MTWTPHATVATLVERDGRFLLVEEHIDGQAVLNQPAGHVERGESLVAAAVRETLEETGWDVMPSALLGIYIYTAPSNGVTYHRYCFIAEPIRHHPQRPLDPDITRTLWLNWDELEQARKRLRSPLVYRCCADYRAGKRYPLELIYEHPC